jgi:hypothetical protein
MEVITCGAVPSYGEVLGGKLVAMLLCTPAVAADFAERYDRRTSLIASGLAGKPIRRRAQLAVLTTSSLWSVGSSQYNRIHLPAESLGGTGDVRYKRTGTTDRYLGPCRLERARRPGTSPNRLRAYPAWEALTPLRPSRHSAPELPPPP